MPSDPWCTAVFFVPLKHLGAIDFTLSSISNFSFPDMLLLMKALFVALVGCHGVKAHQQMKASCQARVWKSILFHPECFVWLEGVLEWDFLIWQNSELLVSSQDYYCKTWDKGRKKTWCHTTGIQLANSRLQYRHCTFLLWPPKFDATTLRCSKPRSHPY